MRGFTLIEMVVVTVLIAVLAALLTPIATQYIDQTRLAAAQAGARAIGEAIQRFEKDVGRYPIFNPGTGLMPDTSANIVTLRGAGNVPQELSVTAWTSPSPTDLDCLSGCVFYSMTNILMTNLPGYPTTSSLAKPFKWKGPYIDASADPWGNAYLVNIINVKSTSSNASFVLSAGPNGSVETGFNQSSSSPVSVGGDDIIFRIK